jgi:hypothetical protein
MCALFSCASVAILIGAGYADEDFMSEVGYVDEDFMSDAILTEVGYADEDLY